MRFIAVSVIIFSLAALCAAQVTTQQWSLYVSGAAFWGGIGRDWNGTVYAGLGNHRTDDQANCVVYRYNNSSNDWTQVADVSVITHAAGNWLALDRPGKIHSTLKQGLDGKIFWATHSAFDTQDDLTEYPNVFRGGHFYSYDPATGQGRDLSDPNVGGGHVGFTDFAIATQYNLAYGVGYPYGYMYKQDIRNGDSTFLWATQSQSGLVSRIVLEDNFGRFLCPNITRRFLIYDPVSDSVKFSRFRHPIGGVALTAAVKSWTGDTLYYIATMGGHSDGNAVIYRYIAPRDTAEVLCYVDSGSTAAKANLAIRWDQNKLYCLTNGRLYSYNASTGARSTVANISGSWYGCNGVDRNGDLFFTGMGNRTVMKVTLNQPCAICTQKPKALDSAYIDSVEDAFRSTAVEESADKGATGTMAATPNPFNPAVLLSIGQKFGAPISLMIFDTDGRMVADLTPYVSNGKAVWHANGMASGVYIAQAVLKGQTLSKRLILMK